MPTTGTAPARELTGPASARSDHEERSRRNLKKFSLCAFAIALCIGSVALLASSRHNNFQKMNDNVSQNASAPFRDGLYLGRLAARHGDAPHMATGRWQRQEDQALFVTATKKDTANLLRPGPRQPNRQPGPGRPWGRRSWSDFRA
jgi:hypothetical protein